MAKALTDIRSLARVHTETAIRILAGIMQQTDAPHAARVSAATQLLDRGWGKPHQTSDVTVRKAIAKDLADDELANIALGGSDGTADAALDPQVTH